VETAKIKYALSLASFIAVLVGLYLWESAGGKLTVLNEHNFAQFVQGFDGAANRERVLLLLSPT
jgi:hypothetical protein